MTLQVDLSGARKTLFARHALREAMQRYPAAVPSPTELEHLERWRSSLHDPARRAALTEPQHAQPFLLDIFGVLLSYRTVAVAGEYHMEFEGTSASDSRRADAVLGFLGRPEGAHVRAVLEVKRPGTDLDARSGRTDRLSAVDQAFLYASNFGDVSWVIVTNFDEIRLYSNKRGKVVHEAFRLQELVGERLQTFLFLLRRSNLIGDGREVPPTERLAEAVWQAQAEITKKFYAEYQDARVELFEELRRQNASEAPLALLAATQTLLDRLLFVMFCSDRHLLPRNAIAQIVDYSRPDRFTWTSSALWSALLSLFRAVDQGHPASDIPEYNGGLFREALLDRLRLDEEQRSAGFVLRRILRWDRYDFESQLDVEILGHIFENSISDLEHLQREIAVDPHATRLRWRNQQGIFYTPEWVTTYIIRHTVEQYLDDHPEVGPEFKVLDPACGSGAFLTQLVPAFLPRLRQLAPDEVSRAEASSSSTVSQMGIFEDPGLLGGTALYTALRRSIYGVDKSHESVEITKLSFWLKTAIRGRALPSLDANIQAGNSLVRDRTAAEDAFDWPERLPALVAGGAHVVVGNPPWGADTSSYAAGLAGFRLARGQYDSAFLFVELAFSLLTEGGYLGFIVPDSILRGAEHREVRRLLAEENTLVEVIKAGEGVFPGVFRGSAIVIARKGTPPDGHRFRGLIVRKEDRRQINDVTSSGDLDALMAERSNGIPVSRVQRNPGLEIDLFVGDEDEALISKIEDRRLDIWTVLSRERGIELNRDGWVVQCPRCFTWNTPPLKRQGEFTAKTCSNPSCGTRFRLEEAFSQRRIISEVSGEPRDGHASYVDGSDLNRYRIDRVRAVDLSCEGIDYKDPETYSSPKLLLRKTGVGITATIDLDRDAYVPQSVYIYRLLCERAGDSSRYRLEYILGLLNSRVMLYHYFKKTANIEWQSFPYWALTDLAKLPFRAIDWDNLAEVRLHDGIADAVAELLRRGATGDPTEDLHIERIVMDLYGINAEDAKRIWGTLRSVQELKAIREVLPPTGVLPM
jgi:type I restriction-modification system DNA methylase subunit